LIKPIFFTASFDCDEILSRFGKLLQRIGTLTGFKLEPDWPSASFPLPSRDSSSSGFRLSTPLTHPTLSSRKKMFAVAANTTVRAVAQVKATKAAAKEQKSA